MSKTQSQRTVQDMRGLKSSQSSATVPIGEPALLNSDTPHPRMSSAGASFYRDVLRACRRLPRDTQSYYRHHARENFVAHRDEYKP